MNSIIVAVNYIFENPYISDLNKIVRNIILLCCIIFIVLVYSCSKKFNAQYIIKPQYKIR